MSSIATRQWFIALALSLMACGGGSNVTGTNPSVAVTFAQDSQSTLLGRDMTYNATFASVGGFSGTVNFTVDSLPAGWTVDAASAMPIVLTAGGSQSRTIGISIATDAAAGNHTMVLHAVAASHDYLKPFKLVVFNEYEIEIPLGTGNGDHWGALVGSTINMKVGATLNFRNADTVAHRIHANGGIPGFAHEPSDLPPGDTYSSTFTGAGTDWFNCHDHESTAIKVNLAVTQ